MGEGFLKFHKRLLLAAWLKALLCALSLGLPTFSVLFVLSKREIISLNPLFSLLIGLAVALLSGALAFLWLRPNRQRLAKRLDTDLGLHEKVQTMVAFNEQEGDMLALQRHDTDNRLKAIPAAQIKIRHMWAYITAFVLALAILTVAVLVPAKEPPAPPVDPDYEMTDWQAVALQNLIAYVQASKLEPTAKDYTVVRLEGLLTDLADASKESRMKTTVIGVIVDVDAKVDAVNSYPAIKASLTNGEDADLEKLSAALEILEESAELSAFDGIRALFVSSNLAERVGQLTEKIDDSLKKSGYSASDALFASLSVLSGNMAEIARNQAEYDADTMNTRLDVILTTASEDIHEALWQQDENRDVSNYVIRELMNIFGIFVDELPNLGNDTHIGTEDSDDGYNKDEAEDDKLHGGGLGTGNTLYGSDDAIWDPDENAYVKYGEVINKYLAQMNEKLLDGALPEDLAEYINDYFAGLYSSSKNQE